MEVDFSYKWYKELCEENDLNPNNVLSMPSILDAKRCAKAMKMYMTAKENYPDEDLQIQFDYQIDKWNNERIASMFNALELAQVMNNFGKGADQFFERILGRGRMRT